MASPMMRSNVDQPAASRCIDSGTTVAPIARRIGRTDANTRQTYHAPLHSAARWGLSGTFEGLEAAAAQFEATKRAARELAGRMRTFAIFRPDERTLSAGPVLLELSAARDRLLERTCAAAGLDLRRAVVVSPVTRLFRLPLGGYLAFLAAHDRRHLWQARQVRAAPGFGAA
jgi:hypothetical protein